jgi:allantoinase
MASFVVCSAQRMLLPDNNEPTPATIVVDKHSGKIIQVRLGQLTREEIRLDGNIEWIEAGNNIVLPGLVECVQILLSYDYLIRDIFGT